MFKRPSLLVCFALMLAAPGALAGPAAAQEDQRTRPPVPKLDWQPCDPGFQCATASVPRDYTRPNGPKVELALIRRPASDRENRIGSLFFNPGGPGGSGVDFVRTAPPFALETFGRLYDIVGFDPRGVGASRPAIRNCAVRFGDRIVRPETADRNALVGSAREQLARCEAGSGGILPYLTTANVARDLDLLRAAVGDEKLNYVGLSYGTLIGETYTTLFPGRTGALVFDSPVDGDVWLNRPFESQREQTASFEGSIDRFLHWCSRHEDVCALDPEDPEDDFDALVERLNETPAPVLSDPSQDPVSGDEVLLLVGDSMYSKFLWAPLAAALAEADQGDGTAVREQLGSLSGEALSTGAFFAYQANEARYPGGVGRFLREMEHSYAVSDHLWFVRGYEYLGLTLWPFEARGIYRGPYRHSAAARTPLVIGGTHDPATPYKWAKRYVSDLGNARLLTYRSDGHGALTDLNPCVSLAFLAYIEDGALPPAGASCRQELPGAASAERRSPSVARLQAWKRTIQP